MDFSNAVGFCIYSFYKRLWRTPIWVLDLFIPFLCEGSFFDNFNPYQLIKIDQKWFSTLE